MYNYYRWNIHIPSKFKYETLTPSLLVLGGGAFGTWLGHEDGALTNGVSAHMRRDTREIARSLLSAPWAYSETATIQDFFSLEMTLALPLLTAQLDSSSNQT